MLGLGLGCSALPFPRIPAISRGSAAPPAAALGLRLRLAQRRWLQALVSALPVGAEPSPSLQSQAGCSRVACPQTTVRIPGDTATAGRVTREARIVTGGFGAQLWDAGRFRGIPTTSEALCRICALPCPAGPHRSKQHQGKQQKVLFGDIFGTGSRGLHCLPQCPPPA